jgi:hypothetical protein
MKPTEPRKGPGEHPIVHHHAPEELHNDDVAHEHSDVNVQAILTFVVGLTVITVAVAALMVVLFNVFEGMAAANDPVISPVAMPSTQMPARTTGSPFFGGAPAPQLLTNEPSALRAQRLREQQQLTGYGWVDEKSGVARLPIDEAKKLILERGLPSRAEGTADPLLGTNASARGEASGGRLVGNRAEAAAPGAAQPAAPQKTEPPKPDPKTGGH